MDARKKKLFIGLEFDHSRFLPQIAAPLGCGSLARRFLFLIPFKMKGLLQLFGFLISHLDRQIDRK